MDRRALLLGGVAVGAGVAAGAADTLRPRDVQPRSTRPHSGVSTAMGARVVWRTAPATPRVALSFDDGPNPEWTPVLLDVLARHRVHATFFVVGSRANAHRSILQRTVEAGHEVGNHTWTHADLCRARPAEVAAELGRTADLLDRVTGAAPALVRPPWGRIDAVGIMAAAELGCDVVLWSDLIRAADPTGDLARTLLEVRAGAILLAHDGGPTPTAALIHAVDLLVGTLLDQGYTLGTVNELLRTDPVGQGSAVAAVALPWQRATS